MDQDVHIFDGSSGHDSMTEIEYVAAAFAYPPEDLPHLSLHVFRRAEKGRGVEVPLDGTRSAHRFPGLVQRKPPVDAHDVAARLTHQGQQVAGIEAEMDAGDRPVQGREKALHMAHDVALVVRTWTAWAPCLIWAFR